MGQFKKACQERGAFLWRNHPLGQIAFKSLETLTFVVFKAGEAWHPNAQTENKSIFFSKVTAMAARNQVFCTIDFSLRINRKKLEIISKDVSQPFRS